MEGDLVELHKLEDRKQDAYAREAAIYDDRRYANFGQRLVKEVIDEALLELLQVTKGMRVLDVATGTGRAAVEVARHGATVIGVDLTQAMLLRLRSKISALGLSTLHLQRANARQLPFRAETFDRVVSLRFMHLIPFQFQHLFLEEMLRVLKPGGLLAVSFNSPYYAGAKGFLRYLVATVRRRAIHLGYLWPSQERALFRDLNVVRRAGTGLPGIGAVGMINRGWAMRYGRLAHRTPFVRLSKGIIFVCQKAGRR